MNPFDFINHITSGAKLQEKDMDVYDPFLVNRGLSLFWDTCLIANELNIKRDIPKEAQLKFLELTVSKKKRFEKWPKLITDVNVKIIQDAYGYSDKKAKEALEVLTHDELKLIIANIPDKGGTTKKLKKRRKNESK